LYVQGLVKGAKNGMNQRKAYLAAGYNCTVESADEAASRLSSSIKVKNRMSELIAPAVQKTEVSVQSLLAELEITIRDARSAKQHGVVVRALELAAKLVGLLKERVEITAGGYGGAKTSDEILAEISASFGEEFAQAARRAIGGEIIEHEATPVVETGAAEPKELASSE
jgi:hypothetical protein